MYVHLPVPILLVVHTVTSFGAERPRDCSRVFYFDFEKHVEEGEGGIWQGQEGEVTFGGGKAWLSGKGSLIYPFFAQNDLRPSFAFSFKIKPVRLGTGDRVAIITNSVSPGSSTLTVFHNETCVGVKVIETVDYWPLTSGVHTRNVELSVNYTKLNHKIRKRGFMEQGEDAKNTTEGLLATGNNDSLALGGTIGTSGIQGEESSGSTISEDRQREVNKEIAHHKQSSNPIIAVKPLFIIDDSDSDFPFTWRKRTTSTTTVSVTTTSPVEATAADHSDSDDRDTSDDITVKIADSSVKDIPSNTSADSGYNPQTGDSHGVDINIAQTTKAETVPDVTSRTGIDVTSPSPSDTLTYEHTTLPGVVRSQTATDNSKPVVNKSLPVAMPSVVLSRLVGRHPVLKTASKPPVQAFPPQRLHRFLVVPNTFSMLQDEEMDEIEVRLAQDNGVLSLQVGDSPVQRTNVGSMEHVKAPSSALRVGKGDGLQSYRGTFDDFIMYDCPPVGFFKEPSSNRYPSDMWARRPETMA